MFSIFSPALVVGDFLKMFSDYIWGCRKCFIRNNTEVVKGDGETMRSLCLCWYVSGGVRTGCRKGWGELRNIEERRG